MCTPRQAVMGPSDFSLVAPPHCRSRPCPAQPDPNQPRRGCAAALRDSGQRRRRTGPRSAPGVSPPVLHRHPALDRLQRRPHMALRGPGPASPPPPPGAHPRPKSQGRPGRGGTPPSPSLNPAHPCRTLPAKPLQTPKLAPGAFSRPRDGSCCAIDRPAAPAGTARDWRRARWPLLASSPQESRPKAVPRGR